PRPRKFLNRGQAIARRESRELLAAGVAAAARLAAEHALEQAAARRLAADAAFLVAALGLAALRLTDRLADRLADGDLAAALHADVVGLAHRHLLADRAGDALSDR